jgi:uncharacterized Zn-finger protein
VLCSAARLVWQVLPGMWQIDEPRGSATSCSHLTVLQNTLELVHCPDLSHPEVFLQMGHSHNSFLRCAVCFIKHDIALQAEVHNYYNQQRSTVGHDSVACWVRVSLLAPARVLLLLYMCCCCVVPHLEVVLQVHHSNSYLL